MNEGDEVSVVSDQMGTPTFSDSLAVALWCMAEEGILGMHHWTDLGETTWHGFATAIEEIGFEAGLIPSRTKVNPITTEEYPTLARRPRYSVMDKSKTWKAFHVFDLSMTEYLGLRASVGYSSVVIGLTFVLLGISPASNPISSIAVAKPCHVVSPKSVQ